MPNDQTQTSVETTESQPSDEVLALLGQDQAVEPTVQEEVTPESEPVKTEVVEEEETNPSEEESEESEESGDEPETKEESDEAKKESHEFLIAGVKYNDISEATKAINRISGDNTRLAGDVNSLTNQLSQKDQELQTLQAKVKEWQDFYDNGEEGKKPDEVSVEDKVRKVIQEERKQEQDRLVQTQFQSELDALPSEPDYSVVLPHMLELANKLGDTVRTISPKTLYQMARGIAKTGDTEKVLDTANKIADEKTKKIASREQARKVIGGNARKSPSIMKEEPISPEVAVLL